MVVGVRLGRHVQPVGDRLRGRPHGPERVPPAPPRSRTLFRSVPPGLASSAIRWRRGRRREGAGGRGGPGPGDGVELPRGRKRLPPLTFGDVVGGYVGERTGPIVRCRPPPHRDRGQREPVGLFPEALGVLGRPGLPGGDRLLGWSLVGHVSLRPRCRSSLRAPRFVQLAGMLLPVRSDHPVVDLPCPLPVPLTEPSEHRSSRIALLSAADPADETVQRAATGVLVHGLAQVAGSAGNAHEPFAPIVGEHEPRATGQMPAAIDHGGDHAHDPLLVHAIRDRSPPAICPSGPPIDHNRRQDPVGHQRPGDHLLATSCARALPLQASARQGRSGGGHHRDRVRGRRRRVRSGPGTAGRPSPKAAWREGISSPLTFVTPKCREWSNWL
jgi:hypothetical protein